MCGRSFSAEPGLTSAENSPGALDAPADLAEFPRQMPRF
jgi:hypothetical protein